MFDLIKSLAPRIVQDLIMSAATLLVAHGYITASQSEGFVGSAFFIAMLVVNAAISHYRKADAAQYGASAVGGTLSQTTANAIAKGITP